jgi:DNA-binding IclR family transcriptional regulator
VVEDADHSLSVPAVKSAERALRVVELLATSGPVTFAELRRELDMPKSSLHALITTMKCSGWVTSDRRGAFTLGFRAHAIGIPGLDDSDVIQLTDDIMADLRDQVDQTVHLARLDGNDIVYLASKFSRHALNVRFEIGRRLPAYVTALGKAMLAELPDAEIEEHLPQVLAPYTPKTITSRAVLKEQLTTVRASSYSEDNEEGTPGIHCFAIAVRHMDIPPIAISCSVPIARLDAPTSKEITQAVLEARARLLARLNPSRIRSSRHSA